MFSKGQTVAQLSESFLQKVIRNHFDSCQSYFDTSVIDDINPEVIQSIWEKIPQYVGEYKSYEDIRTERPDTTDIVLIRCVFEKTKLDMKFAYNRNKKIIGVFFVPPRSKTAYNLPDYYEVSKQYENKIPVKTGTMELPGVLCVPNNITDPPVVLLLAGSGPNDKDETIGPNKPLKDLAVGLASNGIASYRYDKRAHVYASKMDMNKTGLYEEVVEDALNAIKLLRANPVTKNSKIIVAGHSLGAFCAPWIASKSKEVSGVIMLAGPARPLEDLADEQIEYLLSDKFPPEKVKERLAEYKKHTDLVRDPKKLKKAEASELPFGLPSYYWQSVKKYDHIGTAKKLKQPVFVIQGERDYQVKMADFNIWKKELENDPKNKFRSYEGLNHLLQKGDKPSKPEEYNEPGNADVKVIRDIIEFVKGIK